MNIDTVTAILNQAIQVTLIVSMPSVGLGLAIGLIVAVFQAVTQIQEQTLTFVPKMVVVMIVIGATFPWMSRLVMEMALSLWENIPLYSQ
ncbi:flagellar biosynthetic protein FliQ [bacterium]|jgi:flagellar biosynthesis protein FliQ|nr:flagellar biosynthetic protein FliQ [bacterium]